MITNAMSSETIPDQRTQWTQTTKQAQQALQDQQAQQAQDSEGLSQQATVGSLVNAKV